MPMTELAKHLMMFVASDVFSFAATKYYEQRCQANAMGSIPEVEPTSSQEVKVLYRRSNTLAYSLYSTSESDGPSPEGVRPRSFNRVNKKGKILKQKQNPLQAARLETFKKALENQVRRHTKHIEALDQTTSPNYHQNQEQPQTSPQQHQRALRVSSPTPDRQQRKHNMRRVRSNTILQNERSKINKALANVKRFENLFALNEDCTAALLNEAHKSLKTIVDPPTDGLEQRCFIYNPDSFPELVCPLTPRPGEDMDQIFEEAQEKTPALHPKSIDFNDKPRGAVIYLDQEMQQTHTTTKPKKSKKLGLRLQMKHPKTVNTLPKSLELAEEVASFLVADFAKASEKVLRQPKTEPYHGQPESQSQVLDKPHAFAPRKNRSAALKRQSSDKKHALLNSSSLPAMKRSPTKPKALLKKLSKFKELMSDSSLLNAYKSHNDFLSSSFWKWNAEANASPDQNSEIENLAMQNWIDFHKVEHPQKRYTCNDWLREEPSKKVAFLWSIISSKTLSSFGFENFSDYLKQFFVEDKQSEDAPSKHQINKLAESLWSTFTYSDKLPFILEAVLVNVAIGNVDPTNEEAVKTLMLYLSTAGPAK